MRKQQHADAPDRSIRVSVFALRSDLGHTGGAASNQGCIARQACPLWVHFEYNSFYEALERHLFQRVPCSHIKVKKNKKKIEYYSFS